MPRLFLVPFALALFLTATGRTRAESYTITNLGSLGGGTGLATGLNDAGQVIGYGYVGSYPFGDNHALLWSEGKVTDLGTLGGTFSNAYSSNASGQVVGESAFTLTNSNRMHAFLWSAGKMTDLGTLPGYGDSTATAVNASGQVAGTSSGHAFLYSGGKMTDLGTLNGAYIQPSGINASGQVTGNQMGETNNRAFLYSGGKMTDLGSLGGVPPEGGIAVTHASALNASGQVVGSSYTPQGVAHAFLYSGGKMTDLGTLGGGPSFANGINDAGQVVGSAGGRAFLLNNGKMVDLNSLISPESHWTLFNAIAINNSGQILAGGYNSSAPAESTVLLTPTAEAPEPGSLTLVSLGALGLAGHVWRKQRRRPAAA